MSDEDVQSREHARANNAAKAFVEALQGVGSKGRVVSEIGLCMVSDVRAHGPLVVVDGVTESGVAFRFARHYAATEFTIVLGEDEPGDGTPAADTD